MSVEDMLADNTTQQRETAKRGPLWLAAGALGFLALMLILRALDTTTELVPEHPDIELLCWALGALGACAMSVAAIRLYKGQAFWRRVLGGIGLALFGFLSVSFVSDDVAKLLEGAIDFPRDKTGSCVVLLPISRAYRSHGKGVSWHIQTRPWSDMEITEQDYNFMLRNKQPGDAQGADEISSLGYFCARVTVEQSGEALRVLHAGSHALPGGTVTFCPTASGTDLRP